MPVWKAHSNFDLRLFKHYAFGNFSSEGLFIRSFLLNGSQKVIGTQDGFIFIDEKTSTVSHFNRQQLEGASIVCDIAFFSGHYYIGTYNGGVFRFDPATCHISRLGFDPLLNTTSCLQIKADTKGRLWLGTSDGVFVLDSSGRLTRYTEDNSKIYGGIARSIVFNRNGNGWIAFPKGLSAYNASTSAFSSESFPKGFFNHENLKIRHRNDGGLLFISRYNLFYTDLAMTKFGRQEVPQYVMNEGIRDLFDDGRHYWLSTDKGLFRMDTNMDNIVHFDHGTGLCCSVIGGEMQCAGGYIWIGTDNGLYYASMDRINKWISNGSYKAAIYDIRVAGERVSRSEESVITREKSLWTRWNLVSDIISFKPILHDFAHHEGRMFEYRVDGERQWHVVNDRQGIEIKNLGMGTHTLQVRLAGVSGSANTYTITCVPTLLAIFEGILICVILSFLVLWSVNRRRIKEIINERNDIADALVEVEEKIQETEVPIIDAKASKYHYARLNEDDCKEIVERMKAYIEEQKPYTNPNLRMSDIADYLHVSASKLSMVFQLYMKCNYYEFINGYRLNEFKRLIAEGGQSRYTITALSEQSGFKRSNFFSTFRKVEGMTPVEYLRQKNSLAPIKFFWIHGCPIVKSS